MYFCSSWRAFLPTHQWLCYKFHFWPIRSAEYSVYANILEIASIWRFCNIFIWYRYFLKTMGGRNYPGCGFDFLNVFLFNLKSIFPNSSVVVVQISFLTYKNSRIFSKYTYITNTEYLKIFQYFHLISVVFENDGSRN